MGRKLVVGAKLASSNFFGGGDGQQMLLFKFFGNQAG
jgi:hypothetical protein